MGLPRITSHVEFLLIVAVDCLAMQVGTIGTADERGQGVRLLDGITESAEVTTPIKSAPPGACP